MCELAVVEERSSWWLYHGVARGWWEEEKRKTRGRVSSDLSEIDPAGQRRSPRRRRRRGRRGHAFSLLGHQHEDQQRKGIAYTQVAFVK